MRSSKFLPYLLLHEKCFQDKVTVFGHFMVIFINRNLFFDIFVEYDKTNSAILIIVQFPSYNLEIFAFGI